MKNYIAPMACSLALLASPAMASTITLTTSQPARDTSYCREYTQNVLVAGRTQQAYGTACLQPDGSWAALPGDNPTPVPATATTTYVVQDTPVVVTPVYRPYPVYYPAPHYHPYPPARVHWYRSPYEGHHWR